MNFQLENTAEILDKHIGGFRQYRFGESAIPTFVSQNLCDMTGYSKEELADGKSDLYADLICPADRGIYEDLLKKISKERSSGSAEYRIITKDGRTLYVRDTVTAEAGKDGVLIGYAVLTDITAIKSENDTLHFLNETVPCGMIKYTCEKNPKVTYVNEQMLRMLRFSPSKDGELDYLEMCKENIYLSIPMEERRRFAHFLNQVYRSNSPVSGEITVLRADGTKAHFYGWVTKVTDSAGNEEFQSVCMDVTEKYRSKRANETERYLNALSEVYDKIYEYDFQSGTVKYVSGTSDTFSRIRNLPMHMEEATEQWIENSVCYEDRERMHSFFSDIFTCRTEQQSRPPQIRYRSKKKGSICSYIGIFLKISSNVALFCTRKVQDASETESLRSENLSLKTRNENMQEMMMRYNDGVAAFEVIGDMATPLYASDNVCEFFGFAKEEWLALMQTTTPIKEFVSRSPVDYEKFRELLQLGEAEFTYYDIGTDTEKRIKAICSQKNADASIPRYVMLYKEDAEKKKNAASDKQPKIYIRTFGYFDVFIGDKPIAFRNKKAKELLALLVDRRGGYVTCEEAIGYLWENEPASSVTQARYRKEALRLKNALEEHGIGHIMESVDGKRRIIPEMFECDLYDYLSGKEEYAGLFKGCYLNNYPWGEITLGQLVNESMN